MSYTNFAQNALDAQNARCPIGMRWSALQQTCVKDYLFNADGNLGGGSSAYTTETETPESNDNGNDKGNDNEKDKDKDKEKSFSDVPLWQKIVIAVGVSILLYFTYQYFQTGTFGFPKKVIIKKPELPKVQVSGGTLGGVEFQQ
jgi:hypothetical protein